MKKTSLLLFLCLSVIGFGQNRNPTDRDPDFNPFVLPLNNYYIDGDILKMGYQSDGKILILHRDASVSFDKRNVVRLNDNLLDFNFGLGFNDVVDDFAIQPDGKIIFVGKFTTYKGVSKSKIVRLNSDGSIDNTFIIGTGFNHKVINGTANGINKIVLQADGKILVAGSFSDYNGKTSAVALMRLNSNGTLDASLTSAISNAYSYSVDKMAVQSDGKILVSQYPNKLSRLNSNGSLDATFNIGTGANQGSLTGVVCQNDGKIILLGEFSSFNGTNRNGITRLNSDGSNDATFVGNISGSSLQATDIALQSDGKMFLVGNFSNYGGISCSTLVRLNLDGTKDSTFDVDKNAPLAGQLGTTYAYTIPSLLVQPDGKILCKINTSAFQGKSVNQLLRFNIDGSRDYTIDNICKGFKGNVTAVAEQSDGKILVGGDFYSYNGQTIRGLARINADGTNDTAFNANVEKKPISAYINGITGIKVLPDGKIIVVGDFYVKSGRSYFLILNPDGTQYTGFNVLFDNYIRSIAVQPDGKIIVAGDFSTYKGKSCKNMIRIFLDGTLDTSFNFSSSITYIYKIDLQSDNKIIVCGAGGTAASQFLRLNTDGTVDTTFNSPITDGSNFIIQPDGKILLTRNTNSSFVPMKTIRVNSNGAIDTTFNFSDSASTVSYKCLALQPDGKILISGYSIAPYVQNKGKIKRLNTDGSVDLSYSMPIGFNTEAIDLFALSNGKLIATGSFSSYNGLEERSIVRIMGQDYYFLQGQNKLDISNNGCDAADIVFPNLKFQVSNTTNSMQYISNASGSDKIALTSGKYTITPTFENPSYFSASPPNITVDFPTKTTPVLQDFCISTIGIHPDLEISIIPITVARPGFDAKYKIVFKNKGNQIQSGSVVLTYDDVVTDLVSALPIVTAQTGNKLSWDFINLNPFESREIDVVLNLNTPTETPPLNNGELLNFTVSLRTLETDETPNDNEFLFPQTVVGSYDPNDKTCLEGATISKTKVGDYVHYQIRFENSGTYPAQNITVKDVIDTSKFDISTLIPEKGSHSFITRIVEGNKVEFVFENINLPFDDASNDGYVTFKIKTVSALVSGNTFSNSASIYFDYNSAVTTNIATTTVASVLQNHELSFDNYFVIYPNPVDDILKIHKNNTIEVKSVSVFNVLGQVVMVIPNAINIENIDVSSLKTGTYFIKINSDRGTSNTKFVKM